MPEIDAEKLMHNIQTYGSADGDPNATATPESNESPESAATQAPQDAGFRFNSLEDLLKHQLEYKAGEKPVKEDLATILKRASQGYNYAQNIHKFKTEREAWDTERTKAQQDFEARQKQIQDLEQKYSPFEKYAQENPEWYEHWQKAYETRNSSVGNNAFDQSPQQAGSNSDLQSQLNAMLEAKLQEKLKPYESVIQNQQEEAARKKIADEDAQLDNQIRGIQARYPEVDFSRTDPDTGQSLEWQVFEHMSKTGIKDFESAFKSFYHEPLVKLEVEKRMTEKQKEQQGLRKNGIIEIKDAPSSRKVQDTKNLSWDQLTQIAAKEHGIRS